MQNVSNAKLLLLIFSNSKLVIGFLQISKNMPKRAEQIIIVAFVYLSAAFFKKIIDTSINSTFESIRVILSN